ncbi:MAG: hypothetical protein ACI8QC_002721 [Planctomycetota bacterium]|jgi:hypothetical protein
MLTATHAGFFARRFEIRGTGGKAVTLRIMGMRAAGHYNWEGDSFVARAEGFGGRFNLERRGKVVAYANKSFFSRRMDVFMNGAIFELKAVHPFSRDYMVRQDSLMVGTISSEMCLTRDLKAKLPDSFSIPQQMFLLWLVSWMQRQRRNT